MSYTISIHNRSAVLYDGTAPVAAVAGDRRSLARFIEESGMECGEDVRVYGEHRLAVMQETKVGAKKKPKSKRRVAFRKAA